MLKLIVYLVLGFYSTYMEVVQLVSKIRRKISIFSREKEIQKGDLYIFHDYSYINNWWGC